MSLGTGFKAGLGAGLEAGLGAGFWALTSEDFLKLSGHDLLLGDVTMLLDGQDQWIVGRYEGVLSDTLDYIIELDL